MYQNEVNFSLKQELQHWGQNNKLHSMENKFIFLTPLAGFILFLL